MFSISKGKARIVDYIEFVQIKIIGRKKIRYINISDSRGGGIGAAVNDSTFLGLKPGDSNWA